MNNYQKKMSVSQSADLIVWLRANAELIPTLTLSEIRKKIAAVHPWILEFPAGSISYRLESEGLEWLRGTRAAPEKNARLADAEAQIDKLYTRVTYLEYRAQLAQESINKLITILGQSMPLSAAKRELEAARVPAFDPDDIEQTEIEVEA